MARERWLYVKDGNIIKHSENDGWSFAKRGPEEENEIIMSVEEAKEKGVYKDLVKQSEVLSEILSK
jgi:hypothetical protein|tara:strand:+ start:1776 stop:1973 length:198 start_codon:yes stop_codon:yes gene_type:complete